MNKEELEKCDCGNDIEELHTCPFLEEIRGDSETLCNCCKICEKLCSQEI